MKHRLIRTIMLASSLIVPIAGWAQANRVGGKR
jgi:hypothetical protein